MEFRKGTNTSHGIILFTKNDKDETLFLVAKRRYTYAYIEFLFRKHRRERQSLIHDMTYKEIAQLLTYKFEKLWEDFHLEPFEPIRQDEPEVIIDSFADILVAGSSFRKYAHELFIDNMMKYRDKLLRYIEHTNDDGEDKKIIWEFPKGKRNSWEIGKECALRELKEETGIESNDFVFIDDYFVENYEGDDGRLYTTVLYPAFIVDYKNLHAHKKKSKYAISDDYISSEIKLVKWMNRKECSKVLPDTKMKFVDFIVKKMKAT